MEIHKNTNKQMNDLLNEARHEKPVMNLMEVEGIIARGKYTPAGGGTGFHIGMNNLIVVCGIVVSSFLAYMALKVDKGDLVTSEISAQHKINSAAENNLSNAVLSPAVDQSENIVSAPVTEKKEPAIKSADREMPVQNQNTLLASNKNMVASASESDEEISIPVAAKIPSGEYVITFNYAGQDIRMKLLGDEVSEFSVDGNPISSDQYNDFDDILSEGKNYLIGNTHAAEGASSLNLIRFFDGQLRSDKILTKEVQYHFELTSSLLMINSEVQSDDIFKKYRKLYESKTGKSITEGSVYKFERGARSE